MEYPTSHSKEMSNLERRALKEGWVSLIDENAEGLVKRQIEDALDPNNSPRDRRGSFSALMQAKKEHEKKNDGVNVSVNLSHVEFTEEDLNLWRKECLEGRQD